MLNTIQNLISCTTIPAYDILIELASRVNRDLKSYNLQDPNNPHNISKNPTKGCDQQIIGTLHKLLQTGTPDILIYLNTDDCLMQILTKDNTGNFHRKLIYADYLNKTLDTNIYFYKD